MNLVTHPLTNNELQALTSLVNSIGEFNFKISTLLKAINTRDREQIKKQWLRWAMVDGRVDDIQLLLRKQELALFFGNKQD